MDVPIQKIAQLARLRLSEQETQRLSGDLKTVLEYIGQLKKLDTDGVEPTSHVLNIENVFREDEVNPGHVRDEALKHAPAAEGHFFKVPKTVDRE